MGAALPASDQYGRTSWALWGRATTNSGSSVLKLKENPQKDRWLHKHEQNKLGGMLFHQQHPSGGHLKEKFQSTGLGEVTKREYMRCTAAKLPAAEEPQDNSKRPILLHQEHFSVLKIKKESYKNGNEDIRVSIKGKLKSMGAESETG